MPNQAYLNGLNTLQAYQKIAEANYIFSFRTLKLLEDNNIEELNRILDIVIGSCADRFEPSDDEKVDTDEASEAL